MVRFLSASAVKIASGSFEPASERKQKPAAGSSRAGRVRVTLMRQSRRNGWSKICFCSGLSAW
jgi:hypothetical protein